MANDFGVVLFYYSQGLELSKFSFIFNASWYIYTYIYIVYMWQKSSVFSHESAQRNVAGRLIDKNIFKTTRSFRAANGFVLKIFSRWPPPIARFMFEWFIRICLMSGNTEPLVAKRPCCFKDIFISLSLYLSLSPSLSLSLYIYIYICTYKWAELYMESYSWIMFGKKRKQLLTTPFLDQYWKRRCWFPRQHFC